MQKPSKLERGQYITIIHSKGLELSQRKLEAVSSLSTIVSLKEYGIESLRLVEFAPMTQEATSL